MAEGGRGGSAEPTDDGRVSPHSDVAGAIDVEATERISAHLLANETLVWAGRPDPASRFTSSDIWLVPFSVLWFGFAVFWCIAAFTQGGAFGLFGLPFVALGAYMAIGRFFYKSRRHRVTRYGLTDQRALVVSSGETHDVPLQGTPVAVKRSRDGRHVSVRFGRASGWPGATMYANSGMEWLAWASSLPLSFYDVADVDSLLRGLDEARSRQVAPDPSIGARRARRPGLWGT